jgi:hypothetical protein
MFGTSLGALETRSRERTGRTQPLASFHCIVGDGVAPPLDAASDPDGATCSTWCSVAEALADLAAGDRGRVAVRLKSGGEAWELGLERTSGGLYATLFCGGATPQVLVHERRVDAAALHARAAAVLRGVEASAPDAPRAAAALARLRESTLGCVELAGPDEPVVVAIDPPAELPFALAAEVQLRPSSGAEAGAGGPGVLRADLLGLLFRGRLRITVGGHARELADVHVFLVAEQLAALAHEGLEAHLDGRAIVRKVSVGGALCGIRVGARALPDAAAGASVTLGHAARVVGERADAWTFPGVDPTSLAEGVLAFGRALSRSLVRRDRAHVHNLRLVAFRARLREIGALLREHGRNDAKVNPAPESYRAFAAPPRRDEEDRFGRARLRFSPRWHAAVPSIDLRATFLCGDGLVVGSAREMCWLDRSSGEIAWRRNVGRATTVLTPAGVARIDAEGELALHDLRTGEPSFRLRLVPRVGAATTGAVVASPGLPRMLIVSEGQRQLAGVDLEAGEIRFRYVARRAGAFRLRRAGKLVVVANGEQALTALDVVSGEVVWRYCDRLRFASLAAVDADALFAVAGDGASIGRGGTRLHHIDPWTGRGRWSVDLPPGARPFGAPLLAPDAVLVASQSRRGTALLAYQKKTGRLLFEREACLGAASSMIVDDLVILNSESGELVALDAHDGTTRYRHLFADGSEGDRPRRLEPVLRCGALFVPQADVHVLRPRDGTVLGTVKADLVPDLLRVDERCDVYVAEESGHVSSFAAATRLTLVT